MAVAPPCHVLIAVDGSPSARAALRAAVRFPWPTGASGSAVVATQAAAGFRRAALKAALAGGALSTAQDAARALSRRWPDAPARVVDASPVEGILDEARRVRATVIVMGWRGHGAVRRLLAGSVSRGVVRRAACPVLVVRRPSRAYRRLVIGVDGSAHAERALALVAAMAPPRGGHVTLVRVVDTMAAPGGSLVPAGVRAAAAAEVSRINKARLDDARRTLSKAAARLSSAGWAVDPVVTGGAPLRELLASVARARADVLVVGARGVSGMSWLVLGSVADGALNASPVPVLIVR
jgi:nucleotide-binding universal stress UspA family protein